MDPGLHLELPVVNSESESENDAGNPMEIHDQDSLNMGGYRVMAC